MTGGRVKQGEGWVVGVGGAGRCETAERMERGEVRFEREGED